MCVGVPLLGGLAGRLFASELTPPVFVNPGMATIEKNFIKIEDLSTWKLKENFYLFFL